MRFICFSLLPLLAIAGCASTSTQMVNDKGQVANCGAWGFGIIGAPAALITTQDCIARYQAAGFREAGSLPQQGAGASPAQHSIASTQIASTTPVTLSSKDGSFKIILPAGWVQAPPPSASQQLFAKNSLIDAGLLMNSVNGADIRDWEAFAESSKNKLVTNLSESTVSEVRKIKVNGFDALQTEIAGTLKNGIRIKYLGTLIKTDKILISMLAWSFESKFAANRAEFESLPARIQL